MKKLLRKVTLPFTKMRRTMALAPLADDLHEAWQEREERPLSKHERELLENALSFGEITAEDVCVPRSDIAAVPITADFSQVMAIFRDTYHSRLLVIGNDLDDIRGMVMLKDMASCFENQSAFKLEKMLRPVVHVPETMHLPKVLQQMNRHKSPMVVVNDEFGGTSGLLVLRDILEELVGEIEDEHDHDDDTEIVEKASGVYVMGAEAELEDVAEKLKLPLEDWAGDEVDTIGGWVAMAAQRIPQRGDVISLGHGLKAVVVQATPKQVQRVELHVG